MAEAVITDDYALYHGDCCAVIPKLPKESVGFSVFSPPFASLYAYSDSMNDMGNAKTYEEFFTHFGFLVDQLFRVMVPGRVVAVHAMDLPTHKNNGEEIGIRDFTGDIVRAFVGRKFTYHSRHCIWKDPLVAATRTKAIGLAHKQLVKDSALCRTGIPDYILAFRKPGDNPKPIPHPKGLTVYHGERDVPRNLDRFYDWEDTATNKRSHWIWQQYASPVWDDISQTKVLNYKAAREEDDQRHICLARDSLVLTYDGYKPIQDVQVGDQVLTHKGRWRPVTAKRRIGERKTIRVTAQGVADLRVTPDHKLWTRYVGAVTNPRGKAKRVCPQWIPAEETKASYLNLKLPTVKDGTPYTAQEWWIVGRYLADGHFDAKNSLHISCGKHKFNELVDKLGDRAGFVHDTGTSLQIRLKDPDGRLRQLCERCGKGAANKRVPGEALELSETLAESLLSGYLSGDGHYAESVGRWSASSVSRSLLLGMAMVAQRARGIVASVYAGRPACVSTIEGRSVNCLDDWVMSISPRNKSGLLLDDGAWKKVRSVTDAGKKEVWDISVEEDASFTAEGCIVKNCPLQTQVVYRCLTLWSAKGDVVLTPFMGIGTEVYCAVEMGRKGVGVELKQRYFKQVVKNVRSVVSKRNATFR